MRITQGLSSETLQQLCGSFPGMLQILDPDGRIIYVSKRWLAVMGYSQVEVIGYRYTSFLSVDSQSLVSLLYLPELTARDETYEVGCEIVQKSGALVPALLSVAGERDELGELVRYWVATTDVRKRKRTEAILRKITKATATKTGDDYFNALVHELVRNFGVSSAFVTQCADQTMTRVRTLALMQNSTLVENIEYDLAGTPCAGVINGSVCYFPEKLSELFRQEEGRSSYFGVPFYSSQGHVLGHLAIMDEKPLHFDINDVAILEIFAARSGAELECQLKAKALYRSTDELNHLYAQLQDQNRHLEETVSERTREIERRRCVAESLRDMVLILNSDRPLDDILEALLADASRLLGTESGALFLLQADQNTLVIRTTRGLPDAYATNLSMPVAHSLVGQAVLNRQPIVISDVSLALDEQQVDLDPHRRSLLSSQYQTLLAVPLIRQAIPGHPHENYGCIALYYPERQDFSDEAIRLAATFGAQAALAIENARLRERAQRVAIMEERTRLARELHDSVTQSLYSLTLLAEGWRYMASEGRSVDIENALTELGELGQQALKEMRLLIHELRPPELDKERLLGALHKRLAAVEQRAGIETHLFADELVDLPPEQEETLYAIAQEALNNALKHAAATAVDVHLHVHSGRITLEIKDNGSGFDSATVGECGGLGLVGMRERAERIGGALTVQSYLSVGTTVTVTVENGFSQKIGARPCALFTSQQTEVQHAR